MEFTILKFATKKDFQKKTATDSEERDTLAKALNLVRIIKNTDEDYAVVVVDSKGKVHNTTII